MFPLTALEDVHPLGISCLHQPLSLAAGEGSVGESQKDGGQREEEERQKPAQGSPGKSLIVGGREQWPFVE